jgi:ribosome-binding ATPase YchF (GTP1/OBG family)
VLLDKIIRCISLPLVGVVGKPNVGKSTFFMALTMVPVKIAPYPFTTINPNKGIANVRVKCVCREFGVTDSPRNSKCIDGIRYVPVEVIDVAGLVPDAWKGKGLGNKFLDDLRQADALIHVVDASGGTDAEGNIIPPGTRNPLEDVKFVEREFTMWVYQNLERSWDRDIRGIEHQGSIDIVEFFYQRLSGYSLPRWAIADILEKSGLINKPLRLWNSNDRFEFIHEVLLKGKPMLIVANKADLPQSKEYIDVMRKELKNYIVVPVSAEAELILRTAQQKGLIDYIPGSKDFVVKGQLSEKVSKALEYIRKNVLDVYGSTGVQEALELTYFKLLNYIAVFPVEDVNSLSDHEGRVLPDVFLVPNGTTAKELAYKIHSDLGESFLYAVDARSKQKLGENYKLKHRDIIKIVATKGK